MRRAWIILHLLSVKKSFRDRGCRNNIVWHYPDNEDRRDHRPRRSDQTQQGTAARIHLVGELLRMHGPLTSAKQHTRGIEENTRFAVPHIGEKLLKPQFFKDAPRLRNKKLRRTGSTTFTVLRKGPRVALDGHVSKLLPEPELPFSHRAELEILLRPT